ncbi:uncharacterized protein N7515_007654 [Penicillium bovifimosum]|uniref:Uncharacterized protein n=1 Tax=Penicillium bovifimosum TaxID=126998 RepID=A0A9W9GLR9_9EURO|nr:uncharacterized protein N7515_007654 [Penicillium bovifimosum]KAJ5123829.1 hypothetical protein N7515_007654 [Penicillium bovifimosum]
MAAGVLVALRGISNMSALCTQYTEYRLEIREEHEIAKMPLNVPDIKHFLTARNLFIESMRPGTQEVD